MVKQQKNIVLKRIIPFLFCAIIFVSCDITDSLEKVNLGVPVYELTLSNENYGLFVSNEYSNLTILGKLRADNATYKMEIKHHGNSSRGNFKKNYSIEFETSDPVLQRKNVVLSAHPSDHSTIRPFLAASIFNSIGLKTFNIKPIAFYLNDTLLGLYYLIEPINVEFFEKRNIQLNELYKGIYGNSQLSFEHNKELRNGFEKRFPKDDNYYTLEQLVSTIDNEHAENYAESLEKIFDVDSFLKYTAVSVLVCNWDGIHHNFYIYKNGTTGKYEIMPWDLDCTFNYEDYRSSFPGTSDCIKKLLKIQKYRDRYKEIFNECLERCFSDVSIRSNINYIKHTIEKAYREDRWLQANSFNLDEEINKIIEFTTQRRAYIQEQLINYH